MIWDAEHCILKLTLALAIIGYINRVAGYVALIAINGANTVDETSDVTLTCQAICSYGPCRYTWYNLTGLDSTLIHPDNTLKVINTQRKFGGGKYSITCIVRDNHEITVATSKELDVFYGPDDVLITPKHLSIQEGSIYPEVACKATNCYPVCEVTWTKGGVLVSQKARLFNTTAVATRSHTGIYVCQVTNVWKQTQTSRIRAFNITVQYPPDVTVTWNSSTATIACQAEGVPASYDFGQWRHTLNDVNIRTFNGTRSEASLTYTFSNISYRDRGSYECMVHNEIVPIHISDAWVRRAVSIIPYGAPDPPADLKITDISHDTVALTFKSGFFNGASQTFVVEYRTGANGSSWLNGSSVFGGTEKNLSLSAMIGGLSPKTFYIFRSYGYNIYNRSEYVDILLNATTLNPPLPFETIIGGAVGGTACVVIVLIVVIVIYRWRRSRSSNGNQTNLNQNRGFPLKDKSGQTLTPTTIPVCNAGDVEKPTFKNRTLAPTNQQAKRGSTKDDEKQYENSSDAV